MSPQPHVIFEYKTPPIKPMPDVKNEVYCYKTGQTPVTAVCHHSGRFLSSASEVRPNVFQDHSLEFAGILSGNEAKGAHSKNHAHFLPYSPLKVLIIPGSVLAIWGIWLLINVFPKVLSLGILGRGLKVFQEWAFQDALALISPLMYASFEVMLLPLILTIIGLFLFIVGVNQYQIFTKISMSRPLDALPLLSDYYNVVINEQIHLSMMLSPVGQPYLEKQAIRGEGKIALEIFMDGQEIERIRQAYQEKGKKYGFESIDDFNLGWLYVKPSPYTQFCSEQHLFNMRQHIPPLENTETTNWYTAATYDYTIDPDIFFTKTPITDKMGRALLWVRPLLKQYSAGHILQLEFEIIDAIDNKNDDGYESTLVDHAFLEKLKDGKLEYIEIQVKEHPFPGSTDFPVKESRGRISVERNSVRWQNIPLVNVLANRPNYSFDNNPLVVTFSQPLTRLKSDSPLEISFKITVAGASISGVEIDPDYFWLPNGRSAKNTQRNFTTVYNTELIGRLSIQPEILAYEKEITSTIPIDKAPGVPLTSAMITVLVNELEVDASTHIKSIVKSTPVTEVENNLAYQKQSWDISGRVYTKHNHPLDFHIFLINRTPLAEGESIVWGSVAYRCLQIERKTESTLAEVSLEQEVKGRSQALHQLLKQRLQSGDVPADWQTVVSRTLS